MARKKIREFQAKELLLSFLEEQTSFKVENRRVLVTPKSDLKALAEQAPWVETTKLVVKPDQLFGKRKKHNLVLIDASWQQVQEFIQTYMDRPTTINSTTDKLTHFLVEPYIPHKEEYYLAITSERCHDTIYFSEQGGIDIEENWDNVTKIHVPTLVSLGIKEMMQQLPCSTHKEEIALLAAKLLSFCRSHHFSYLELNPFTFSSSTQTSEPQKLCLLDCVAQVDSCAAELNFPKEFGKIEYTEEQFIRQLDHHSGSSLKLTILNPLGSIWNILSGGGASVIYLDMLANLGHGSQIANYGESSGNPSEEESYQYAKTILQAMCKNNTAVKKEQKKLFIAGGIANFTDVKATFTGIARALEEFQEPLLQQHITIYVRRGGPNEKAGLEYIKETLSKLGIPHYICGPETSMPDIIKIAQEAKVSEK